MMRDRALYYPLTVRSSSLRRWCVLSGMLASVMLGCSTVPLAPIKSPPELAACVDDFNHVDTRVDQAHVRDPMAATIPGFPFLRVDRLLASYRNDSHSRAAWVAHLAALDRDARHFEFLNLPGGHTQLPTEQRLDECRMRWSNAVLSDPARLAALQAVAAVPDEYRTWQRVVGFYPLAAIVARRGVARLQADNLVRDSLPTITPNTRVYRAGNAAAQASLTFSAAPRDALGLPQLSPAVERALFARYAPDWRVTESSPADHIGHPIWQGAHLAIVPDPPLLYTYLTYTRFGAEVLVQLNYVIWFPRRDAVGALDLLAGEIDGLTWRVTLDRDGEPLIFDTIHNCGCYHLWFPTARVRVTTLTPADSEPLWVPFTISNPMHPLAIQLASGNHYVTAVGSAPEAADATTLKVADYAELRSLVKSNTRAGMFAPDGVVNGSERAERFVLWPLGVPAPGAMRSHGHHATAFVGRRHFDEANLIERYFQRVEKPEDNER